MGGNLTTMASLDLAHLAGSLLPQQLLTFAEKLGRGLELLASSCFPRHLKSIYFLGLMILSRASEELRHNLPTATSGSFVTWPLRDCEIQTSVFGPLIDVSTMDGSKDALSQEWSQLECQASHGHQDLCPHTGSFGHQSFSLSPDSGVVVFAGDPTAPQPSYPLLFLPCHPLV